MLDLENSSVYFYTSVLNERKVFLDQLGKVAQLVGVSSCTPTGCGLDPWSGTYRRQLIVFPTQLSPKKVFLDLA